MLAECPLRRTLLMMDNYLADDEFATQLMMLLQYALSLQIVAMDNHLAEDGLAAQLAMTLPECRLCLQLVAMRDCLVDDN
jgi:hypothetical protein